MAEFVAIIGFEVIIRTIFAGNQYFLSVIFVFRHFFYRNYVGLSLWPFIFLKENHLKRDAVLINHEKIHLRQQSELLVIPFYMLYVLEWLLRFAIYFNAYKAYQNLSFEREAYANERDLNYLEKRKPFRFVRYYA